MLIGLFAIGSLAFAECNWEEEYDNAIEELRVQSKRIMIMEVTKDPVEARLLTAKLNSVRKQLIHILKEHSAETTMDELEEIIGLTKTVDDILSELAI